VVTRRVLLAVVLLLTACGWGGTDDNTFIRFDWIGWNGSTLALTEDHGTHYHIGISRVLQEDSDPDRPVRVHVKEYCRCFEAEDDFDVDEQADWYLHSGDHKEPFAPIPESEVEWLAGHSSLAVETPGDPMLAAWAEAARLRINDAVGFELLTVR
jgi:hypothetical protein